jgi:hypothetical protein
VRDVAADSPAIDVPPWPPVGSSRGSRSLLVRPARPLALSSGTDAQGTLLLFTSHGARYLARLTTHRTDMGLDAIIWSSSEDETLTPIREPGGQGFHHVAQHRRYGSRGSLIVDMQGIDSFLYGRAKLFRDETARQAVLALGLVDPEAEYLRVGASGAPATADHPGGEVLECSVLAGHQLSGRSATASGYLPGSAEYSVATPLALPGGTELLDGRSIYSHTAFLAAHRAGDSVGTICLRVVAHERQVRVLDVITQFARQNSFSAYALRLFVRPRPGCTELPRLVGRVLRHLPHRPLRDVAEAGAIASEQSFYLRLGQQAECFGTYYPRHEPDWERFRGGKPYEPRGHVHMILRGQRTADSDQHELSHLRELYTTPQTDCLALITPIARTLRIDPVVRQGDRLYSRSSGRILIEVLSAIAW